MAPSDGSHTTLTPVLIPIGGQVLHGDVGVPAAPQGFVMFAHGSGSSRHSPRNQFVARHLRDQGLGTLLVDLLTPREEAVDERTREFRFNIGLLGQRLTAVIDWLRAQGGTGTLPLGLFGASTGAGAALIAAAARPSEIKAIVSRGGRPDLAGDALPLVHAPTLLIVGGDDESVIELNRQAMDRMRGPVHLEVVAGATHLFEEPGTLEHVAELAASWFVGVFRTPGDADGGRPPIASR